MAKDTRKRDRKAYYLEYYKKNADKIKAKARLLYAENPSITRERQRKWRAENREHVRRKNAEYIKQRRKSDPKFALTLAIRKRTHNFMRQKRAQGSVTKALGCSWQELCQYIESKFQPGMTWSNRKEWHIDHIKPLSSFDLTNQDEFNKAVHYTNLQPLWAVDNLRKSNRL